MNLELYDGLAKHHCNMLSSAQPASTSNTISAPRPVISSNAAQPAANNSVANNSDETPGWTTFFDAHDIVMANVMLPTIAHTATGNPVRALTHEVPRQTRSSSAAQPATPTTQDSHRMQYTKRIQTNENKEWHMYCHVLQYVMTLDDPDYMPMNGNPDFPPNAAIPLCYAMVSKTWLNRFHARSTAISWKPMRAHKHCGEYESVEQPVFN